MECYRQGGKKVKRKKGERKWGKQTGENRELERKKVMAGGKERWKATGT
jgi:hypothetical protein